jgi:hypothetical protein
VLTEFGLVFGKSPKVLCAMLADVIEDASQVGLHVRASPTAKRAAKVVGIGELGASAPTAGVGDFTQFKSGHHFSAWLDGSHARPPAAARPVWGASQRVATTTCVRC